MALKKTFGRISSSIAAANAGVQGRKPTTRKINSNASTETIQVIPEYLKIKSLLREGCSIVLVTGGAGTGKSTFIRWIENEYAGKVLLCAPTGIAALTIGGKTLHSLCGFPPSWIVDKDIRFRPQSVAAKAELLVIDEISMVNANLLDAVSEFFKLNRKSTKPFGGVQLVVVGDLFQLPPVVTGETLRLFKREYDTPKFFSAHSLRDSDFATVELTKPFRQKNTEFFRILANIREGNQLSVTLDALNSSCEVTEQPPDGAVWLCPRNAQVNEVNSSRLSELPGKAKLYTGILEGQFKEDRLPALSVLELKVGAQVVMTKNAADWVNGSIAFVTEVETDKIKVRLLEANKIVEVHMATWEQYDYVINESTDEIERIVVGTFKQIPAILAWAMTIHKSQGLTLDAVHLDLGAGAFASGQTYVALSRVRTIDQLTFSKAIRVEDVRVDQDSSFFYKSIRE